MKQLQNNFTTPEQSKRLLKLGLPADSADCFYGSYVGHPDYVAVRQTEFETEGDALFRLNDDLLPCWSVGRLIEIMRICQKDELGYLSINIKMLKEKSLVERCIFDLDKKERFDFSKLED